MRIQLLFTTALLAGCFTMPPKAPTEVDDLTRFLFREWAHEEPSVLQEGVRNLEAYLEEFVNFSGPLFERSFELDSATVEDIAGIPHPDEDPAKTIGMAVAYESEWPLEDHTRLQVEADLMTEAEPSAKKYVRRFIEPKNPACFPTDCNAIYTENDITRSSLAMTVDIMLHKDFKWVKFDGERRALVSRSWNPEIYRNGKDAIVQSYTLDVWIERPDGKTWRYQALYQESILSGILANPAPKTVVDTVTSATDSMFEATDKVIKKHYRN